MPDFTRLTDLVAARLGGSVIAASDEFFAPKERLIVPEPPAWEDGRFTDRGKWMDGWETRRRRDAGHDWCVIRLAAPGVVHGVVVETTHFRGNHPEACCIEACAGEPDDATWRALLDRTPLQGDSAHAFEVEPSGPVTHVKLHIHPDGGVARLRVYGEVHPDWASLTTDGVCDLAAALHGGRIVGCSDECFGVPSNLLMPGPAVNMGDGWETRRRRGPGHDWCVVRLGCRGVIETLEVDTMHFKGNYPDRCAIDVADDAERFEALIEETPLEADHTHRFEVAPELRRAASHVRLRIMPDGGVARLRVWGRPA